MKHRFALFLLPVLAWMVAVVLLAGGRGFWNDDYSLTRIDPVTGAGRAPELGQFPPFVYRPLFYLVVPTVLTWADPAPWAAHLAAAGVLGATGVALGGLLRRAGAGASSAAVATAVFIAAPFHAQAVLWISAIPTQLAVLSALAVAHAALSAARAPEAGGREPGTPWRPVAAAAAAGSVLVLLNEQPLPAILALPLLAAARPAGAPAWPAIRRAMPAIVASLAPAVIYGALALATAPAGWRTSAGSVAAAGDLPRRAVVLATDAWSIVAATMNPAGVVDRVRPLVLAHPVAAAVVAAALLASVIAAGRGALWSGPDRAAAGCATPQAGRLPSWLVAYLFAAGLASLTPILLARGLALEPRHLLAADVWLLPGLVVGADLVMKRLADAAGSRWVSAVAGAAAAVLAVSSLGVQALLADRWEQDGVEASAIVSALPDPGPGAVVVPLVPFESGRTGQARALAKMARGPLEAPWSAGPYLRRAYGRRDLTAAWAGAGFGWTPVVGADPRGLRYNESRLHERDRLSFHNPAAPADNAAPAGGEPGDRFIPWARVAAFVVVSPGLVEPATHFAVTRPDGSRRVFEAPETMRLASASGRRGVMVCFTPRASERGHFTIEPAPNP